MMRAYTKMADISATLEAKSDQLNATDIFGAEPVIRVRDVQLKESAEQPIWIFLTVITTARGSRPKVCAAF